MNQAGKRRLFVGLVGALAIAAIGLGEVKSSDRDRLDRAMKTRDADVQKSTERFRASVADANDKLQTAYNLAIQQYDKAGDKEAAESLKKELADVLARPIDTSVSTTAPAETNLNRELIAMLGNELVRADGSKVKTAELAGVPNVLIYFSASWCGPCKAFTPDLVAFFNKHADSRKVMVVFVSRDRSPADMMAYMKDDKMPWVGVPFANIQKTGILKKYGGSGIPNLVLLNTDGTVKSGSYVNGDYVGPRKVLRELEALLADEKK